MWSLGYSLNGRVQLRHDGLLGSSGTEPYLPILPKTPEKLTPVLLTALKDKSRFIYILFDLDQGLFLDILQFY